jgi:hypothetical protein
MDGSPVFARDVAPPYRLKLVAIYSCMSADEAVIGRIKGWKDHVSKNNGSFILYDGSPNALDANKGKVHKCYLPEGYWGP